MPVICQIHCEDFHIYYLSHIDVVNIKFKQTYILPTSVLTAPHSEYIKIKLFLLFTTSLTKNFSSMYRWGKWVQKHCFLSKVPFFRIYKPRYNPFLVFFYWLIPNHFTKSVPLELKFLLKPSTKFSEGYIFPYITLLFFSAAWFSYFSCTMMVLWFSRLSQFAERVEDILQTSQRWVCYNKRSQEVGSKSTVLVIIREISYMGRN